jgi:hypothetical protein
VSADLPAVISATARWLVHAYPPAEGALNTALGEVQAQQAATVAAWLRYPTAMDASLLTLVGPGGSAALDWVTGVDFPSAEEDAGADDAWRSWVDEVIASWAACLLADRALAADAAAAVASCEHLAGLPCDFGRLTDPDERDRAATVLLRHPDLHAPVARLHAAELRHQLAAGSAEAA